MRFSSSLQDLTCSITFILSLEPLNASKSTIGQSVKWKTIKLMVNLRSRLSLDDFHLVTKTVLELEISSSVEMLHLYSDHWHLVNRTGDRNLKSRQKIKAVFACENVVVLLFVIPAHETAGNDDIRQRPKTKMVTLGNRQDDRRLKQNEEMGVGWSAK